MCWRGYYGIVNVSLLVQDTFCSAREIDITSYILIKAGVLTINCPSQIL